jgi:DNA repair exonuclease SbcCD ATPase subunit
LVEEHQRVTTKLKEQLADLDATRERAATAHARELEEHLGHIITLESQVGSLTADLGRSACDVSALELANTERTEAFECARRALEEETQQQAQHIEELTAQLAETVETNEQTQRTLTEQVCSSTALLCLPALRW